MSVNDTEQYKNCPFCAETIKASAIKCKHCGSMLGTTTNIGSLINSDNNNPTNGISANREPTPINIKKNKSLSTDTISQFLGIAIVVIIGGLVATNPSKSDFYNYVYGQIGNKIDSFIADKSPIKNDAANKIIGGMAKAATNIAAMSLLHRKDFYIFSEYEIDTKIISIFNQDIPRIRFIGVFNNIYPLDSAEWKKILEQSDDVLSNETRSANKEKSNQNLSLISKMNFDKAEKLNPEYQLNNFSEINIYLNKFFDGGSYGLDFKTDLNGDGIIDFIYTGNDSISCGTGGCTATLILSSKSQQNSYYTYDLGQSQSINLNIQIQKTSKYNPIIEEINNHCPGPHDFCSSFVLLNNEDYSIYRSEQIPKTSP